MAGEYLDFDKPQTGPAKEIIYQSAPKYGYIQKYVTSAKPYKLANITNDGIFETRQYKQRHPSGSILETTEKSLNKKGRWNLAEEIKENFQNFRNDETDKISVLQKEPYIYKILPSTRSSRCLEYQSFANDRTIHRYARKGYGNGASLMKPPRPSKRNRRNYQDEERMEEPVEGLDVRYEITTSLQSDKLFAKEKQDAFSANWRRRYKRQNVRKFHDCGWQDEMDDYDLGVDFDDPYDQDQNIHDNDSASVSNSTQQGLIFDLSQNIVSCPVSAKKCRRQHHHKNNRDNKQVRFDKNSLLEFIQPPVSKSNNTDSVCNRVSSKIAKMIATGRIEPEMHPVRLNISARDLRPDWLSSQYGDNYGECACVPRCFYIDISSELETIFSAQSVRRQFASAQCNFRIIADADSGYKRVDVWLNCHVNSDCDSISFDTINPVTNHRLNDVIQAAVRSMTMIPYSSFKPVVRCQTAKYTPIMKNMEPEADCVSRDFASNILVKSGTSDKFQEKLINIDEFVESNSGSDLEMICEICYDLIDRISGNGMALLTCDHWFCLSCWRSHLLQQIYRNTVSIQCPEYGCKQMVSHEIMTLLLPLHFCQIYADRIRDISVARDQGRWQWCQSNNCDRLIHLASDAAQTSAIACVCRQKWCPKCLERPHFPATCTQSSSYAELLAQKGDDLNPKLKKPKIKFVKVKHCPFCNTPAQKGLGCNHISCVCGKSYCWACLKDWVDYGTHNGCTKHASNGFEDVFLVDVIEAKITINKTWYKKCVRHRHARFSCNLKDVKTGLSNIDNQNWEDAVRTTGTDLHCLTQGKPYKISSFLCRFCYQAHLLLEYTYVWLYYSNRREATAKKVKVLAEKAEFCLGRLEANCAERNPEQVLHYTNDTDAVLQELIALLVQILASENSHKSN